MPNLFKIVKSNLGSDTYKMDKVHKLSSLANAHPITTAKTRPHFQITD